MGKAWWVEGSPNLDLSTAQPAEATMPPAPPMGEDEEYEIFKRLLKDAENRDLTPEEEAQYNILNDKYGARFDAEVSGDIYSQIDALEAEKATTPKGQFDTGTWTQVKELKLRQLIRTAKAQEAQRKQAEAQAKESQKTLVRGPDGALSLYDPTKQFTLPPIHQPGLWTSVFEVKPGEPGYKGQLARAQSGGAITPLVTPPVEEQEKEVGTPMRRVTSPDGQWEWWVDENENIVPYTMQKVKPEKQIELPAAALKDLGNGYVQWIDLRGDPVGNPFVKPATDITVAETRDVPGMPGYKQTFNAAGEALGSPVRMQEPQMTPVSMPFSENVTDTTGMVRRKQYQWMLMPNGTTVKLDTTNPDKPIIAGKVGTEADQATTAQYTNWQMMSRLKHGEAGGTQMAELPTGTFMPPEPRTPQQFEIAHQEQAAATKSAVMKGFPGFAPGRSMH